ncbi:MFS family permease [Pseudomonas cedrina]|nr:MFS family permease [Pseudomonas cedrina]
MTAPSLTINANYGGRTSTRIAFLIAGLVMSAWAPLMPPAKARIGLDEGELGLLLLGLGVGSIVTMPFAGHLTARYSCRPVLRFAKVLHPVDRFIRGKATIGCGHQRYRLNIHSMRPTPAQSAPDGTQLADKGHY